MQIDQIFSIKSAPECYIQSGTFYTDWSTSINIQLKSHQLFWSLRFIYPPLEPLIRLGKTIRAATLQALTRYPLCKLSLSSFQTPLNIPSIPARQFPPILPLFPLLIPLHLFMYHLSVNQCDSGTGLTFWVCPTGCQCDNCKGE